MNQVTGTVTADAIAAFKRQGSWRRLEQIALKLAANAQQQAGVVFAPQLGGGTRLMLALEHRISHDIGLFIRDPQWLGYLTPRLTESFEGGLQAYDENAISLKLRYAEGEIDFIVGMSLLGLPAETAPDAAFGLEPVAEILAKKLFYRGWALTPRDLFDWWMVETRLPAAVPTPKMAQLLKTKFAEIARALDALAQAPAASAAWASIQAPDKPEIATIAAWGQETVAHYGALSADL